MNPRRLWARAMIAQTPNLRAGARWRPCKLPAPLINLDGLLPTFWIGLAGENHGCLPQRIHGKRVEQRKGLNDVGMVTAIGSIRFSGLSPDHDRADD